MSKVCQSRTKLVTTFAVSAGLSYLSYNYFLTPSNKDPFSDFVPSNLITREPHNAISSIFKFKLNRATFRQPDDRSIFHVWLKDSSIQTQRAYTPISLSLDSCSILIKLYNDGQVSRWLYDRLLGDQVDLRGPYSQWKAPSEDLADIVFLVAGTGIAPAFQFSTRYLESSADLEDRKSRRILIFYANKSRSSAHLSKELETLKKKHGDRFNVIYGFDDNVDPGRSCISVTDFQDSVRKSWSERNSLPFILVSGPEGFVRYWAGAPGNFVGDQGEAGGILKTYPKVFKL